MFPIAGLNINLNNLYFLEAKGGSGNLLSSWAIFVLILLTNSRYKHPYKRLCIIIAVLTPFLALSRGGSITVLLYLFFLFLTTKRISAFRKMFISLLVLLFFSVIFGVFKDNISSIPIFYRFANSISEGNIDSSTLQRFNNYGLAFQSFFSNPLHYIFGMGFDKEILTQKMQWSYIESFYLQVLFSSGLIGFALLLLFYAKIFTIRKSNELFYSLWLFIVFESIIMWSITGGDFYSPHVIFLILMTISLGREKTNYIKNSVKIN
jgi:O-antigen ligase